MTNRCFRSDKSQHIHDHRFLDSARSPHRPLILRERTYRQTNRTSCLVSNEISLLAARISQCILLCGIKPLRKNLRTPVSHPWILAEDSFFRKTQTSRFTALLWYRMRFNQQKHYQIFLSSHRRNFTAERLQSDT